MIFVQLNKDDFAYDIHSLVKAFYPSENVSVCAGEKEPEEPVKLFFTVAYAPQEIRIVMYEGRDRKLQERMFAVEMEKRPDTKNRLKRNLYQMLSAYTGQSLPWGTLTGVRPTKIPLTMLEDGRTEEEIRMFMSDTYLTSAEKIALSTDIAKRELR